MTPHHIAMVTGGRADWGLLGPVAQAIRAEPRLALSLIATGQHVGQQGTLHEIEADGVPVAATVDLKITDDSSLAIANAMSLATAGVGAALERLKPDMLLVLGDRYEILASALAATAFRLPIAHVAGGDITEGAMDDAIRHALSKLAHLHFVTNSDAASRLRHMGEEEHRIIETGSPGIDRLLTTEPMDRAAFFASIGLAPRARTALVTFHPVTLEGNSLDQLRQLLSTLAAEGDDLGIVFTGVNLDPGYQALSDAIAGFCAGHANAVAHGTLGARRYISALRHCDVVVGNSSSGLYEAPTFGTPTVNIGSRQSGRLKAASVIDCAPVAADIRTALHRAFALGKQPVTNPYGDGRAAPRIASALAALMETRALLHKRFVSAP